MSTNEIRDGSLKQLWKVSSALMISFLSMALMLFVDRLFLSHYSPDALSAAARSGTLFWAGNFCWATLAAMAEVFVAQYNGSKQYKKLGEPVWQMIWLSLVACIFFSILGSFGTSVFYKTGFMNSYEAEYYRWNNFYAPVQVLFTALSAFYIGQGKTRVITYLGILGNVINVILDYLLIFGYKDIIPSMGIKGAAIATGIGIIVQAIVIAIMFLQRSNREEFGTADWKFKRKPFFQCLKVGVSPAIFVTCELLGWATFYKMMEYVSEKHLQVVSITQSILMLFLFFGLGLEKGAAAVAGNLIGAKKLHEINRVFRSGVILALIFGAFLVIAIGIKPDLLPTLFLNNSATLSGSVSTMSPELLLEVKEALKMAMFMLILYLTLENFRWLLNGILTSAGDTFFIMISGAISIWAFMILPTYYFVVIPKAPIHTFYYIWIFYCIASSALLYFRFWQGKWKEKHLINSASVDEGQASIAPS